MTQSTTYDIIRNRLQQQADELRGRLQQLNIARKEVFGSVESALIANDRITTGNYCTARDVVAVGDYCILGYNVHLGLRSGVQLNDVFSIYKFTGKAFEEEGLSLLENQNFNTDFHNLYRYYKEAYFARYAQRGRHLYMIFHLKPGGKDFKAFKWLRTDDGLVYVDNRSDQEVRYPNQYEFRWQQAGRDDQRHGRHPHVSILDRVFLETTGGDLTIKVEDNTDDGRGIYQEPVEYKDQTLDDAEFAFADLGHLIALRIKPYQEDYRYFVFNEKMQSVERVAALADSGVLLPDQQGLIFANGYYLQTGEYKLFDHSPSGLLFKKRIASPNGEDFLFVFYTESTGVYLLLHYNIISQEVATPIVCNGFTLFPNGELAYFKAEEEPTKHHVLQIWQTPFLDGEEIPSQHTDAYLYKVGNKDIVRAMAECQEILTLTGKEDEYANLYDELVKRATDVLDRYYWIGQEDAFQLDQPIKALRQTANTAIEEYEKKRSAERRDKSELARVEQAVGERLDTIRRASFKSIDEFVDNLAGIRALRGEIVALRDLLYVDIAQVDALEEHTQSVQQKLSEDCVTFLLEDDALLPYQQQIETEAARIPQLQTAIQAAELEDVFNTIGQALEMLIEIVSNLKIEDATQTTRIIDSISALFTLLNQHKAAVKQQEKQFRTSESKAAFDAQLKLLDQSIINYLDLADTPAKCDDYLTKLMVQLEEMEGKFAEVDAFVTELSVKREEVYAALESRKNSLVEARNNRTANLAKAADRILTGMQKRAAAFKEEAEINSFFASDLMVEKVRDLIRQLQELDDSNKANAVQTQLKTLKEDTLRTLRDRKELFVDGENIIRLGQHKFSVNVQPLELTIVQNDGTLLYHLTGTNFYEPIDDITLLETEAVWKQSLVSENGQVYRGEYLAYQLYQEQTNWPGKADQLFPLVQKAAGQRYAEGYTKGIHDADANQLLRALLDMSKGIGLLSYPPLVRACAKSWWTTFVAPEKKALLQKQLKSAGEILELFPNTNEFNYLVRELESELEHFISEAQLFPAFTKGRAATYLFRELVQDDQFVISAEAGQLYRQFVDLLSSKKALKRFKQSLDALKERPRARYLLIRKWVHAFLEELDDERWMPYQEEVAAILVADDFEKSQIISLPTSRVLEGMRGDHAVLNNGQYELNFHSFMDKMERYQGETVPMFEQFQGRKRQLTTEAKEELQLESFKPRVMSSFVRNRLIDKVYLPLFGDNLAKQIGTAGEQTRTDRMGLLLLLSPPGYGKTTLMEYIANRLGLIFMKINGPALGH
ncbi:MAG: DNA repair ATPase, partial [Phaeodactylibacter sp.]|nr:DNA repair ATPase [Phaeodactylibacter sp.]